MRIPQFDLGRAAARVRRDVESRWARLLDDTAFVGGEEVAAFERTFGAYLGVEGCVGVANGTDALELALAALGVETGDEVVVPAFTFVATGAAVARSGARPVLVDVEPSTLNLDPSRVEEAVSERTVGVVAVHLYGRPCALDELAALCERHDLWLLEDAAQAHGARFAGRRVGTFGRLGTWSFYPSKNLGAFGDGGAVSGDDAELVERVRRLANHGRTDHFTHGELGRNSRLDALQAAVLNSRLTLLDADNERRRTIAALYRVGLAGAPGLELLDDPPEAESVYHQMAVLHPERDRLRRHLEELGIGSAVHYPRALHRQAALEPWAAGVDAPISERAAACVLCLPMFPEMTDAEVESVIEAVRSFEGS